MIRTLCAATSFAALALSGPALAGPVRQVSIEPYGGLDYQNFNVDNGTGLSMKLNDGINAHAGARFGRFLGLEIGYTSASASRSVLAPTANYTTSFKMYGPTVDGMYYLPVFGPKFSIIGTAGISYLTGSAKDFNPASPVSYRKSEVGYRGGAGLEWRPIRAFSIDGIARYQSADYNGLAKGGLALSVGFNFYL